VLAVVFGCFAVPPQYRHRALLWGVVGALVLRAGFIAGGAVVLERLAWTAYALGAFVIATGLRLSLRDAEARPDRKLALRVLRRVVPHAYDLHSAPTAAERLVPEATRR
jgi:tellurite resistance protein TerC